ncbi:MAG TPA: DUF2148 domain-containing protein [Bacteroidales bacterium]|nr:DUF2148 domain-containing protein [Bacteroidales bacterium]
MSITPEKDILPESLRDIAVQMMIAARTAPKGRGKDTLSMMMAEGIAIQELATRMHEIGDEYDQQFFHRDAENILLTTVVLLFGTSIDPLGLVKCGMCGFKNCDEKRKRPDVPCVFNTGDLGIAIGSAVSTAMAHKVDNRIMYTVGQAAMSLGYFDPGVKIAYGIPLSATSKSPFFDRQ